MSTTNAFAANRRTAYFDYLRILATFAVMMLHIAAQNWAAADVNGYEWNVFNFFDSIVRWGVPVFTMISGALFLERDMSLKKILGKNVFRLVIAFAAWSFFYALTTTDLSSEKWTSFAVSLVQGHYHMWFIQMIIGLYLCVPILRRIVSDREVTKYFLLLSFLFTFLFPQITSFLKVSPGGGTLSIHC